MYVIRQYNTDFTTGDNSDVHLNQSDSVKKILRSIFDFCLREVENVVSLMV